MTRKLDIDRGDHPTWRHHRYLPEVTREMRFRITHAHFGTLPTIQGGHKIKANRMYFCLDHCGKIEWAREGGPVQELPLNSGSITFIPGGVEFTYQFSPGRIAGFHFNLEIFPLLDIFSPQQAVRQLEGQDASCREMLEWVRTSYELCDMLRVQSKLLETASTFCEVDLETLRRQIQLRNKYADLLSILEVRLDASLSVGQLADELGRTRDSLSKAFRRDLGFSLKSYLTSSLVQKASQLLAIGLNVRETAEKLNFSSEFYFSRFFSKHTGRTPSQYRTEFSIQEDRLPGSTCLR